MIAQFRNRYPNGSLISELLAIDHGKFIVRVLVQVEGVILSTGLAAAETVELAEDQARQRALAILGSGIVIPPAQQTAATPNSPYPATPTPLFTETTWKPSAMDEFDSSLASEDDYSTQPMPSEDWLSATYLSSDKGKPQSTPDSAGKGRSASLPPFPLNNPEGSGSEPALSEEASGSFTPTSSSVRVRDSQDFSSDIAKTDIQLQRLGWTPEQGAAHLQKTYGKRSRRLLTEEELLDFLNYLESLDTPISSDEG
jgi:hypothetical protein